MLYRLSFRDWMELDSRPSRAAPEEPADAEDSAAIAAARTTAARG
jgi:hypothetical protein